MREVYNIYCDESCHLEHDKNSNVMGLGSVWCLKDKVKDINNRIIDIKKRHNIQKTTELKWTKLSSSKLNAYVDLVNYFFDCSDLHFRGLIVLNKEKLNHNLYNDTHDNFYYKMYYYLLRNLLSKSNQYNVYLDIKDSKSATKLTRVKKYLENFNYDFTHDMFNNFQSIRSEEVQIMQLTDILLGALIYNKRDLKTSKSKLEIINIIKQRTKNTELKQTWPSELKFNIFYFIPGDYNSNDL